MPEKIQEQLLNFLTRNFLVSKDKILLDESQKDFPELDLFGTLENEPGREVCIMLMTVMLMLR